MSSHGYRRLVELFDTCFLFIPSLSFKKISLFGLWKKRKGLDSLEKHCEIGLEQFLGSDNDTYLSI